MSILRLLLRRGNFIQDIEIDAFLRESATSTARVTRNPVENGADVNDHIIIEPMRFVMEGVVSDTASNLIDVATVSAEFIATRTTRSQAVWTDLLNLQASRTPFTLIQGLKSYDNVVIESLSESQDKSTANALFFTANLVEIVIVDTEAPPNVAYSDTDVSDKASPSTSSGQRQLVN